MGYSYDMQRRLCCDNCGQSGGVRKRKCPAVVVSHSTTAHGVRLTTPYCPPPAVCAACWPEVRNQVHITCEQGAALSQRREDAIQVRIDAGDALVTCAEGHSRYTRWVPAGMVGVYVNHTNERYLIDEAEYAARNGRAFISDFPSARQFVSA
jgi:hypothetical protein